MKKTGKIFFNVKTRTLNKAKNLFITKYNQISPLFNDQSPKNCQFQWLYHQKHKKFYQN